jgi:hypothetical protein
VLSGEATNTNFIFVHLTRSGLEPTIYHTRDERADHYATDAVILPFGFFNLYLLHEHFYLVSYTVNIFKAYPLVAIVTIRNFVITIKNNGSIFVVDSITGLEKKRELKSEKLFSFL